MDTALKIQEVQFNTQLGRVVKVVISPDAQVLPDGKSTGWIAGLLDDSGKILLRPFALVTDDTTNINCMLGGKNIAFRPCSASKAKPRESEIAIATGKQVKLFSLSGGTGNSLAEIEQHQACTLAWDSLGEFLAIGALNGEISVWEIANKKQYCRIIPDDEKRRRRVVQIALSYDIKYLYYTTLDFQVYRATLNPDGKYAVQPALVQVSENKNETEPSPFVWDVYSVTTSPDNNENVLYGGDGNIVRCLINDTVQEFGTKTGPLVRQVGFVPNSNAFYVVNSHVVEAWKLEGEQCLASWRAPEGRKLLSAYLDASGSTLFSATVASTPWTLK